MVLQHSFWKFPLLAWAAWQLQSRPAACGTLRNHVTKPFPKSTAPDRRAISMYLFLVLGLDGDPLLAVHRLPDADVLGDERVLLAAGDEDALVPVRLHHHRLTALQRERQRGLGK